MKRLQAGIRSRKTLPAKKGGEHMATAPSSTYAGSAASQPVIGPLAEYDLPTAERIFRLAFGTFLAAPEPETFWSDRDYLHGRWRAPHVAALGAVLDGELVGSNFATKWGSVGFFGPITVRADLQEHGIGQALLAATMDQFDAWGTRHTGLFTFAHSAKHVALYQKFGFHARFLTAIMSAHDHRLVALQRIEQLGEGRGSACQHGGDRHALPGSRPV
jgi:GNAT superfamily N-acetyltransferase